MLLLPLLICKELSFPVSRYYFGIFGRLSLAVAPFVAGALAIRHYWHARSLLEFFAQVSLLSVAYAASVYALALDSEERTFIRRLLPVLRNARGGT